MTKAQTYWQRVITVAAVLIVGLNTWLLFTESWPFSWIVSLQVEYLGGMYTGLMIIGMVLVMTAQLIPLFLLKWVIEKITKQKLTK